MIKECNWRQKKLQINHQPDVTIFQLIILTFIYSSTCFRRLPAHHQEFNDCSGSLWFYLRIVVIVVLCSCSGRTAGPTMNTARLSPRYKGKTRGCHCSHWAPDDGRENARNMLSCKYPVRIIDWKIAATGWWFIWIVRWCTDLQTIKNNTLFCLTNDNWN
jgi:hypothetical protein